MQAVEVAQSLGDTTDKVILDAMNIVMGRGPQGYRSTTDAVLAHTSTRDVVKCFNTTGFNNMADPVYGGEALDLFVAGDSERGRAVAVQNLFQNSAILLSMGLYSAVAAQGIGSVPILLVLGLTVFIMTAIVSVCLPAQPRRQRQ